jgi:cytochrome P450
MLFRGTQFYDYRRFTKNPLRFCEESFHQGGDLFSFPLLSRTFHIVSSPAAAQRILLDQNESYGRGTTKILEPILGDGLLTLRGKSWRSRRQLLQPFFHPREIGRQRDMFAEQIDRAIHEWDRDGTEIRHVAPFMQRLTLSIVARAFLKKDVWNTDPGIMHAMDRLHRIVQKKMNRVVDWPLFLPLPDNFAFKADLAVLEHAIAEIIGHAKEGLSGQEGHELIDEIILAKDPESQENLTAKNIRDEVMTLFLAGHETTAALLTFLLDFLARHPKIQDSLRDELRALPSDYPHMRDLNRLKLLNWTILEVLRLRPSAWSIFRRARQDDQITDERGTRRAVKKRDIMIVSVWNLHHHADYWQQPDRFDPFRMEQLATQTKGSYLPFGTGNHACIGSNFAVFEASLIVSKLLRTYTIETVQPQPVDYVGGITLRPQGDLPLRFRKI